MIYKLQRRFILICTVSVLSVVAVVFGVIVALNISSLNKNMDVLADQVSEGGGRFPGSFNDGFKPDRFPPRNEPSFDFITPETPFSTRHFTVFFDKKGEMTGFETMTVAKGEMPDFDNKFIQPAIDNMARQQYRIGVNPKYLINALSGMKEQETVILEFGTDVQPFLIHPYKKEDLDALSIVLPVRTFGN